MIQTTKVAHRTIKARELDIFYCEAGPKDAPAALLLHGFPTSSRMSATRSRPWPTATACSLQDEPRSE